MTADVKVDRRGPLGLITLDRPQALNALTLPMIRALDRQLAAWSDDDGIRAVVLQGRGKAFCAGGDVVAMAAASRALQEGRDDGFIPTYFAAEYGLDRRCRRFAKPIVALLDGITMGGGVGISQHGSHRVATENTVWAMPETAIGVYPDVGMTHVLPRLPGHAGLWLGLTGARLEAADLLHLGLVSAFVPSANLAALLATLAEQDWTGDPCAAVDRALARHALTVRRPAPILQHRDAIAACFGAETVEDCLAALTGDGSDWAEAQAQRLGRASPVSLKVTLRALRRGAGLAFEACLAMEYGLSLAFCARHDFPEGVRALLIDKDQTPRWAPATLAEVDDDMVSEYFLAPPRPGLGFGA